MTHRHHIQRATLEHAEIVARMAASLLLELSGGARPVSIADLLPTAKERLQDTASFFAYLAFDDASEAVGAITVSTSAAIYAAGIVGTIHELYVVPASRSAAVGAALLSRAVDVGRAFGWNRLEVGAPSQERWRRTIDFYRANGFTEIGPRLGRRLTT